MYPIASNVFIKRIANAITIYLLTLSIASCVVPPSREKAIVIDENELALISSLKRAKDYALAGLADPAELELRRILRNYPSLPMAYNDLGYVLLMQDRLTEAESMLRKSLTLSPQSLSARKNLARVYYQQGRIAESITEFLKVRTAISGLRVEEIRKLTGESFSSADIQEIDNNLAIAYFSIGIIDEALCFSKLALARNPSIAEIDRHARMLMQLGQYMPAVNLFKDSIANPANAAPPKTYLNYSIALFAVENYDLSANTLDQVLSSENSEPSERLNARLIKLVIASKQKNKNEIEVLTDALFAEQPEFCKSKLDIENEYLFNDLATAVNEQVKKLCENENKSFFNRLIG